MRHGDLDREHLASSVAFTRPTGRAYPHGSRKSCRKVLWPFGGQGFDGGARRSPIQCPKPRDVLRVHDCRGRAAVAPHLRAFRSSSETGSPRAHIHTQLSAEVSHLQLPTSLEPFSGSKLDIANANNRSIQRIRRRIRDAKSRQVPITHQPTSTGRRLRPLCTNARERGPYHTLAPFVPCALLPLTSFPRSCILTLFTPTDNCLLLSPLQLSYGAPLRNLFFQSQVETQVLFVLLHCNLCEPTNQSVLIQMCIFLEYQLEFGFYKCQISSLHQ